MRYLQAQRQQAGIAALRTTAMPQRFEITHRRGRTRVGEHSATAIRHGEGGKSRRSILMPAIGAEPPKSVHRFVGRIGLAALRMRVVPGRKFLCGNKDACAYRLVGNPGGIKTSSRYMRNVTATTALGHSTDDLVYLLVRAADWQCTCRAVEAHATLGRLAIHVPARGVFLTRHPTQRVERRSCYKRLFAFLLRWHGCAASGLTCCPGPVLGRAGGSVGSARCCGRAGARPKVSRGRGTGQEVGRNTPEYQLDDAPPARLPVARAATRESGERTRNVQRAQFCPCSIAAPSTA